VRDRLDDAEREIERL